MNFLIVDDSSTMRKIVSLALSSAGHSFKEAENGLKAIEILRTGSFNCIILDINMPEMNGIEFLKVRAGDKVLKNVPVIVLTTQDDEPLRREAMGLGANGFLAKPFQKDSLLATVNSIVGV
jgi:two-component system chemotaxis response regulator CheY